MSSASGNITTNILLDLLNSNVLWGSTNKVVIYIVTTTTRMHACMYTHIFTMHTPIRYSPYTHTRVHIHHAHAHTHTFTLTHTHTHTHTHIYSLIHHPHRYDWILTIVLSVVVPLYLLSGWLHARASVGFAQIRRQALQEATEVSLLIFFNYSAI